MSTTRNQLMVRALELAINRALRYDPGSRAALAKLDQKTLGVICEAPKWQCYLLVEGETLHVQQFCEPPVDCQLRGKALDFAALAGRDVQTLANTDISVEGNPGVLAIWLDLIKALDVDWEEALGDSIGSMPAHWVATGVRAHTQWIKNRSDKLPGYLTSLVTEELRLTPSPLEAEHFYHAINQVRSDTARLEARINQLKQRHLSTP